MRFSGVRLIGIDELRLTQLYLSQKKLDGVRAWFDTGLTNFTPVSVRDFLGDGALHLTDGHTRTFVAWQQGVRSIPVVYDEDDIVTCEIGQIQYKNDITWCERFGLRQITALADRILPEEAYETLWRGRCGYMYDLETALLAGAIDKNRFALRKAELERNGLFVYGITEDYGCLRCEDSAGMLYSVPSRF